MEKNVKNNNKKILIGILIALLLLVVGFYLYYFYPQAIPGMASISPALKEDINVLVIGLDDLDSVTKGEVTADSVILLKLKAKEKQLDLVNLPNTDKKFNENNIDDLMTEVTKLTGVKPDYYFSISYQGFENIINKIDGITITLDEPLKVPDLDLALKVGDNNLSGKEALDYVRWYDYKKDEVDRIKRQQQVVSAIISKVKGSQLLLDIPKLFSTTVEAFKSVKTNIDQGLITEIIEYVKTRDDLEINYHIFQGK